MSGKKKHSMTIGVFLALAVMVYLIAGVVMYFTSDPIAAYRVTSGELSRNEWTTAVALRDEAAVMAGQSGYIHFVIADGHKAGKNETVCLISEQQKKKSSSSLSDEQKNALSDAAEKFSASYHPDQFSAVYELKNTLDAEDSTGIEPESGDNVCRASGDGVISYVSDGMELLQDSQLVNTDFDELRTSRTQVQNNGAIRKGQTIYRMVCSEEWSVILPVDDTQYGRLKNRKYVSVRFAKDQQIERGSISFLKGSSGWYAKVSLNSGMIRYINDRYLKIRLITGSPSGLKIPVSAVVKKSFYKIPASYMVRGGSGNTPGFVRAPRSDEEGKEAVFVEADFYETDQDDSSEKTYYYVDAAHLKPDDRILKEASGTSVPAGKAVSLKGVYVINKGYTVFRRIDILDESNEYCIIAEDTPSGISLYDYIVKDAGNRTEETIVRIQ